MTFLTQSLKIIQIETSQVETLKKGLKFTMDWYNDITKLFMSRGYLKEGQTINEKIEEIVEHSANDFKAEFQIIKIN